MSQRKSPTRAGAGAGKSPANSSSAAPPAAVPAHGIPAAKRAGSGRAPGSNPGKGSKELPGERSCPCVEGNNSRSSPTDSGRKRSANHKDGSGRKSGTSKASDDTSSDGTSSSKAAGDKGTSRSNAAGDKGASRSKAAGDKGTSTSRAAGDKGTSTSKAVGDKGTSSSKAAGDKGTSRSKAAGDKGTSTSRAAGDKGTSSSKAAGDKGTSTSRAAGDKGTSSSKAAGDKGTSTSRAVGDKGTSSSRAVGDTSKAAGDKGTSTSRAVGDTSKAAGDKGTSTSRAAGDTSKAAGDKGTSTSRAAGDKGTSTSRAAGDTSSERDRKLNKLLKNVLENLRIRSDEKSRAAKRVNEVVEHLLRYIRKDSGGCFAAISKLSSGSYYENVKISEPNEFDIMITVPVKRIEFTEADSEGAFYQVAFKRNPSANPLDQFVCDGTLSAEQMLCHLRKLIKQAAKSLSGYCIKVERKKPGCPAVTLKIEEEGPRPISLDMVLALEVHAQSWPSSTNDGLKIEDWLGKKVRRDFRIEPFYLVPKQPLDATQGTRTQSLKEMWRISFSHIEKKMLLNHGSLKTCCENGSPKCCRKSCLKLLKNLIQKLKEKNPRKLSNVCSYHAKTTLLHACVERPKDEMWSFENLGNCFLQLLDNFIDHLQRSNLPHFFVPSYNLFNPRLFDSKGRDTLLHLIESERNKGFPIFIGPSDSTTVTSYSA